jgi:hypothetical protein
MNLKTWQMKFSILAAFGLGAGAAFAQTNRVNPRDFSAFQIINERNIFDANRQPKMAVQSRPRPPQVVDSFSFLGSMSYDGNGPYAVFNGTHSDYHAVLETGGKIAGHTVREIGFDYVKLASGTNVTELKIGMQLRRTADGKWLAAEGAELAADSYASNSNDSGRRYDSRRGGSRFNFRNGNNRFASRDQSNYGAPPEMNSDTTETPTDLSHLDPNDPVARLMLRRIQAEGGTVPNANANGNENFNRNANGNQNPNGNGFGNQNPFGNGFGNGNPDSFRNGNENPGANGNENSGENEENPNGVSPNGIRLQPVNRMNRVPVENGNENNSANHDANQNEPNQNELNANEANPNFNPNENYPNGNPPDFRGTENSTNNEN